MQAGNKKIGCETNVHYTIYDPPILYIFLGLFW